MTLNQHMVKYGQVIIKYSGITNIFKQIKNTSIFTVPLQQSQLI